ncbi:Glyoxalase-like domain protein [Arthrobacter saudimassiliensis]|uniref:Glyoxalase-like domain protein n=1 Tax=Arthrobacter saudimassiliensis TaxID=1461584 RepID=A0A078MPK1_9MICC|nr:Glyoxalase-like domain protein [Arthrobacter saudimassiliensis]
MARMIFPNLPVADLQKSTDFYLGLGFTKDDRFSNDQAAAVVVSDQVVIMLLQQDFFQGFLPKGDLPHLSSSGKEVLLGISCDSREEVDWMLQASVRGGGAMYAPATEGAPGMYGGSTADPDGHILDFFHMEPGAVQ